MTADNPTRIWIKQAAIQMKDKRIFFARRHTDCMRLAKKMGYSREQVRAATQGFITNRDVFASRELAYIIQQKAGIPSAAPGGYRPPRLYSEDLY